MHFKVTAADVLGGRESCTRTDGSEADVLTRSHSDDKRNTSRAAKIDKNRRKKNKRENEITKSMQ